MSMLTQDQLKTELHYNPDTGFFTRLIARCNRVKIGDVAGYIDTHGYRQIAVLGHIYLASRLAWLYMTGEWPVGFEIEHRDLNPSNDKWSNLRKATRSQNQANTRARGSHPKNISLRKGRYSLRMTVNGKRSRYGGFVTIEEAQLVYKKLANKYHGEFARIT